VQVPEAVRDVVSWRDAVDHFALCENIGLYPLHFALVDEDHDFRVLPAAGRIDFAFMLSMYPELTEEAFTDFYEWLVRAYEYAAKHPHKLGPYVRQRERSDEFSNTREILSILP
jgi:hypothetical protein